MRDVAAALLFVVTVMSLSLRAQEPVQNIPLTPELAEKVPGGQVVFSFEPKIPGQAAWEIRLDANQSGTFRELLPAAAAQPLHVGDAVWKRVQAALPAMRTGHCETKLKGIAQTGTKTFSLASGPALMSCTFNYSDDDKLNDAASVFLALAETMHEGAKLQHDHRFEKLALDADMDLLVGEIASGRALEPGNIAPVLQSLVDDDHVIERVRRKAASVLQAAADKPR